MEHQKVASGLGKIRGYLEAGGGRLYHFCGFLQSGGTGMILFWAETWVLTVAIEKRIAGVHSDFWQQVIVKWKRGRRGGTWRQ